MSKSVDRSELLKIVLANKGENIRYLHRNPDNPFLQFSSTTLPASLKVDLELTFNLFRFTPAKELVGATEQWMLETSKLDMFRGYGYISPMILDPVDLSKQVRTELKHLIGDSPMSVGLKDCYLTVTVNITAKYNPKLTLDKIKSDVERFVIAAINKYLQKPSKSSRKRYRTLHEKLSEWLWNDEPFQHFGGRIFSSDGDGGERSIELSIGPNASITILRECKRPMFGRREYLVRRNTLWTFGSERLKPKFLSSLPEGVDYVEMKKENM